MKLISKYYKVIENINIEQGKKISRCEYGEKLSLEYFLYET